MSDRATSDGRPRVQVDIPEGSRVDFPSPNWCDQTTWYYQSIRESGVALADSGDHTTYNSEHTCWIDTVHGRITGERTIRAEYAASVFVDGIEKVENSPDTSDGDYSVDYSSGNVVFNVALLGSEVVTANYSHANGSTWVVKPAQGKKLRLTAIEVQFSSDVGLSDTILFEVFVGGTKVAEKAYQTVMDYINESSVSYPVIPSFGGNGWRGLPTPVYVFRWPYFDRGSTDLLSSMGMEVHIRLENNAKFGGTSAISTVYGISEDE